MASNVVFAPAPDNWISETPTSSYYVRAPLPFPGKIQRRSKKAPSNYFTATLGNVPKSKNFENCYTATLENGRKSKSFDNCYTATLGNGPKSKSVDNFYTATL